MKSVREQALDYLSRREHSRLELQRKLQSKGFQQEEILEALNRLADQDLQNDQRFAECFIRCRSSLGFGPLRIMMELKQRGIAESDYQAYLANLDWPEICRGAWQKKFAGQKTKDFKERARQQRFLLQRGFATDDIKIVMSEREQHEYQ